MDLTIIIISALILLITELVYFRVAARFGIIDTPNHRSSHNTITLRGGGIIFAVALIFYPFYFGFEYIYFIGGLLLISFISFKDDIKPVSNMIRIVIHLLSVSLMFQQLNLFDSPIYLILILLFLVIGSINAINFMDGINGITGSYALITLCTLLAINTYVITFIASSMIITSIISVVVFNVFNFRKKAICFAGDVGSVSIAFIMLFLILQLVLKTENYNYFLLLLLYGLDTGTTLLLRILRKERVFQPHRSHFYQFCVNELRLSHLLVAGIYSILQLFINGLILFYSPKSLFELFACLIVSGFGFIGMRFCMEGRSRLLGIEN